MGTCGDGRNATTTSQKKAKLNRRQRKRLREAEEADKQRKQQATELVAHADGEMELMVQLILQEKARKRHGIEHADIR